MYLLNLSTHSFQGWLEAGRLGVAAFEPIKSKYGWIINYTNSTQWFNMIKEFIDQSNDEIKNYADFSN